MFILTSEIQANDQGHKVNKQKKLGIIMLIYKLIMMILMGKLMEDLMKLGYSQLIKTVCKGEVS